MKADERRKALVAALTTATSPVAGAVLSEQLHVSRQIIVQDIAILRAAGYEILSTHTGYIMKSSPLVQRVFKVRHTSQETEDELCTIVDLGGVVEDVFVWHKIYGKIEAPLHIFSRHGVDQFMESIHAGRSSELMHITSGYHYHTVRADTEYTLDLIAEALKGKNYIAPEEG